jgi:small-conductance mechanosensitive channel/CRP-like cAMP-binding protein
MEKDASTTNSLVSDGTNYVAGHLPLWLQPEWLRILLVMVFAPLIYYLMLSLGRRLKHRHGVKLGVLYHAFSLGFGIFLPAVLLGFDDAIIHHIGAFTVIFGGVFVISLVDRYVWELYFKQLQSIDVPKFLPEVVRLVILVFAIFWALHHFYGQTVSGLIIAPGIAAVVIGFAMQDSLGNIISGIALQAGKPFAHGDWLQLDNRYAEVIEVNWRATRLRTSDDVVIEIPHRQMAAQTIVNLNRPTRRHAVRISVGIDYSASPSRVKDVLLHATSNAKGVNSDPKPKVYLKNFGDSSVEYEIKFWIDNQTLYNDICDSVRSNVWYSLQRHGIKIPFPISTVQIERPTRSKQQEAQSTARVMLRQQPLFKSFTDDQLDALLPRGQLTSFGRGEKVIEQGANGDSMFILVKGEANVVLNRNGFDTHIASLRSGDCFGEMSLLTGEKRSASVVANSDCEVVEIGKPILANSLKENPELLTKLSALLAQRQLENEGVLATQDGTSMMRAKQSEYQNSFVRKLRLFLEL